jgi:hypothetical protein
VCAAPRCGGEDRPGVTTWPNTSASALTNDRLLDGAHQQFGGPVVLVWELQFGRRCGCFTHTVSGMAVSGSDQNWIAGECHDHS